MRTVGKLVGLVATSALVAMPAFASSNVDDELAEMRELVKGLEQKVDAQQEQIEHQSGMLEDAQKVVREQQQEQGALSGMSEFWQAIDVNMSVAGSYAYNFHDPTPSCGAGLPSAGSERRQQRALLSVPSGSQQLPGRPGLVRHREGDHRGEPRGLPRDDPVRHDRDVPGPGQPGVRPRQLRLDQRLLRAPGLRELAGAASRARASSSRSASSRRRSAPRWPTRRRTGTITRGNLYNLLQPIDHLGLMASTDIGPITLGRGGREPEQPGHELARRELREELHRQDRVRDRTTRSASRPRVLYGAEAVGHVRHADDPNADRTGLVDLLATFNSDAFSLWANADYAWVEGSRAAAWGVAVAGMVPLTGRVLGGAAARVPARQGGHSGDRRRRARLLPDRAAEPPQRDLRRDGHARVRARREPHAQERGPLRPREGGGLRRVRRSSSRTPRGARRTRWSASRRSSTRSSPSVHRI